MRLRILAVLSAGALTLLAALPASAESNSQGPGYLALGDSVPFGFNPLLDASNANNFVGYPEIVAKALQLHDTNATCPGEATGGFLSMTGTDNVCRPYRSAFPLHVDYSGTQMAFALDYLRSHKHTQLVTLTLGANDLFRWQKDCAAGPLVGTCPLGIGGVLAVMKANLDTIFANIRGTGYQGVIVAVTYYSLTYPNTSGAQLLAGPMIAAATAPSVHALVASGIEAWRGTAMQLGGGDSCAAGLLIRLSPTKCDVHPTPLGRDLLANAVVSTVAGSCSTNNARLCLARAAGQGRG